MAAVIAIVIVVVGGIVGIGIAGGCAIGVVDRNASMTMGASLGMGVMRPPHTRLTVGCNGY